MIIAEAGINSGNDFNKLLHMATVARSAEADYLKIQKRVPRISVPKHMWNVPKKTPWGPTMPYIEYKEAMELSEAQLIDLNDHCDMLGLSWSASVWDIESLEYMTTNFELPWIKIPSAHATNKELVQACAEWSRQNSCLLIISVGMTTADEIAECYKNAQDVLGEKTNDLLMLMWCHSSYPAPVSEINLSCLQTLKQSFGCQIGYSSHETTLITCCAAIYLGATSLEKHFTLDRNAGGTDDWASVTTWGLHKWVDGIRQLEKAYGDGIPRVYESELPNRKKLRGN